VLSIAAGGHSISAVTARLLHHHQQSGECGDRHRAGHLDGTAYGDRRSAKRFEDGRRVSRSRRGVVSLTSHSARLTASTGRALRPADERTVGSAALLASRFLRSAACLELRSSVLAKTADASKSLRVTGVALPSLRDLLGGLGLDISKLPTSTLENLVSKLGLATKRQSTRGDAFNAAASEVIVVGIPRRPRPTGKRSVHCTVFGDVAVPRASTSTAAALNRCHRAVDGAVARPSLLTRFSSVLVGSLLISSRAREQIRSDGSATPVTRTDFDRPPSSPGRRSRSSRHRGSQGSGMRQGCRSDGRARQPRRRRRPSTPSARLMGWSAHTPRDRLREPATVFERC